MVLSEGGYNKYNVQEAVEKTIYFAENCASHEDVDFVEVIVKDNLIEINYTKNDGNPHWENHKGNWSRYTCENDDEIKSVKKLFGEFACSNNRVNGHRVNYDCKGGFYIHQF